MSRKLHFGLHPYGVGGPGSDGLWKDPRIAKKLAKHLVTLCRAWERIHDIA